MCARLIECPESPGASLSGQRSALCFVLQVVFFDLSREKRAPFYNLLRSFGMAREVKMYVAMSQSTCIACQSRLTLTNDVFALLCVMFAVSLVLRALQWSARGRQGRQDVRSHARELTLRLHHASLHTG